MKPWTGAAFAIVLPISVATASAPTIVEPVTVPFKLEAISGQRPVVEVVLDHLRYRMVVHSNAGFYLQLDHRHATDAGVRNLRHVGAFGVEAPGKVSDMGRDEGVLPTLSIGGRIWSHAPASIFETPGDNATGMLGLHWISQNRIVIDYAAQTLRIAPAPAESAIRDRMLRRAGYAALPMSHDAQNSRYYVLATIGDVSRKMVVSTVASLTVDQAFAKAAGIPVGPKVGRYGGPKGGEGYTYKFGKPVRLSIEGWTSEPTSVGSIEDTYAYISEPRPANPSTASGGQIGADFLIAHRAIVDFGNAKLYLR